MRTSVKLQLLAVSGMMVFSQAANSAPKELSNPDAAKYCPKELTNKQIEELAANKKVTIGDREFHVGPKFQTFAGKRYMELNKEKKAPDTLALKLEKVKGEKAVCLYPYEYKGKSKRPEDEGKEVDRKSGIRIMTMINGTTPSSSAAPAKK